MTADELKAKIEAQGAAVRQAKADKAAADVVQAEVNKLLQLKADYKALTGEDYASPSQAPKKEKKAPQERKEEPPREGPSKKELKKLERKEKRVDAKAKGKEAGGGGGAAPAVNGAAGEANGQPKPAPPLAAAKAAGGGSGKATLYPSDDPDATHTVLAVARWAGVELARGYGQKGSFFGHPPFLELPDGQVVGGHDAVIRAIALAYAPSLEGGRAVVDEWLEWGRTQLGPVVAAHDDARHMIKDVAALEAALGKSKGAWGGGLAGPELTLADLELAPLAKKALGYFGETEYPLVRAWAGRVTGGTAFSATAALVGPRGLFHGSDVEVTIDPSQGLKTIVCELFTASLHKAYPEWAGKPGFEEAAVDRCANPAFGDYQCTSSMGVYKALKGSGPNAPGKPQDVAQALIRNLPKAAKDLFAEVTIAGGGYVNVRVQDGYLKDRVRDVLEKGPQPPAAKKLRVLVDFSSPNIAKEMHVGHLRSTIIGETLCRILEFLGHDVLRVNHVGDWGTQFGMLIMFLKEEYPDFLTNPPNITDLTTFYKAAKKRFDDDADFKERARHGVVKLQAGDKESRAIWDLLCSISRIEFKKVYDRLNVHLEEFGESYYNEMIPGVIQELQGKGLLVEDQGATIMWCGGSHQLPLMVRKSDGGFGYDSTDLAAVRHRLLDLKRDWVVYITDAGQSSHFHLIFDAAKLAGWMQEGQQRLDHVGFGVVQGEDGKRFKTRSGDTVRLVDLLDEAVSRMKVSLEERVKEGKCSIGLADVPAVAAAMGYGAIKYADLKQNPASDYQFSYDRMLDTRGDTAIYLLFTYARFHSILRKAKDEKGLDVAEYVSKGDVVLEHATERALALELAQFPDVINVTFELLMPSKLCNYVYVLSGKATDFLEACHVLTNPHRLVLVQGAISVMHKCLELLAITPLQRI